MCQILGLILLYELATLPSPSMNISGGYTELYLYGEGSVCFGLTMGEVCSCFLLVLSAATTKCWMGLGCKHLLILEIYLFSHLSGHHHSHLEKSGNINFKLMCCS